MRFVRDFTSETAAFNRTIKELKPQSDGMGFKPDNAFNRTIKELKPYGKPTYGKPSPNF